MATIADLAPGEVDPEMETSLQDVYKGVLLGLNLRKESSIIGQRKKSGNDSITLDLSQAHRRSEDGIVIASPPALE